MKTCYLTGGIHREEGWRRRTDEELANLYKETKVTAVARRTNQMAGTCTESGNRMPKMILSKEAGRKKRERSDLGIGGSRVSSTISKGRTLCTKEIRQRTKGSEKADSLYLLQQSWITPTNKKTKRFAFFARGRTRDYL